MFADLDSSCRSSTALLLLDLQESLCHGAGPEGPSALAAEVASRTILSRTSAALARARDVGLLVIHVGVEIPPSGVTSNRTARFLDFAKNGTFARGSAGARFVAEATPQAHEYVVTKTCVDPFVGTSLCPTLIGAGIDTLLLAGVATNFVVEAAARHGSDLGFRTWVLEDMCAAPDPEMHEFSMKRVMPMCSRVATSQEALDAITKSTDQRV